MPTYISSINKRGQVTIPKELRVHLNLKPGDTLKATRIDEKTKTIDLEPTYNPNGFVLHLKFVP
ncbi:hypothetical protein A3J43_03725 [Candidatus Uhrbacteria bacterium RIFCSPHIGHO2_12_FULL_54_23]|uniref:SpoVT-AbrB domain-containing protein n=1 Tax=Candidatus Uhrbacteria bacterium RIFCSPHIGHO2_12_FULL_54_23 TaxID=1802397 RepID=A0A1F7UGG6_9BACT|nr:MAG: hypothetical protein A3J43_03725 [Candidatus Uhrbacteria bacterium RIFCSPHIGHO2_12_FULL_54_23]